MSASDQYLYFYNCREFPITLQGSHVISSKQVWVGVVSKGSDDARLNSSYQNRYATQTKR